MQNSTSPKSPVRFFAAANGYSGFRSYFPEIFSSKDFVRVFVLKGGPGTGKSSILRKIAEYGAKNGYSCQTILCSSDPHSLDGVIIEKRGKRFAALDGTAPHTRDAEIPGAIDEIVNLGENWSSDTLVSGRGLITELGEKKKAHYQKAYSHLHQAGRIRAVANELQSSHIRRESLTNDAKSMAEELAPHEERGKEAIRLCDSFGRFGLFSLDTIEDSAARSIKIKDKGQVSYVFMSELYCVLRKNRIAMTVYPDVFDGERIRSLHLHGSDTFITVSNAADSDVDTEKYLTSDTAPELCKKAEELHSLLLKEAKGHFTFASDLHFELEKIYTGAMNFTANDSFVEKIIDKIEKAAN